MALFAWSEQQFLARTAGSAIRRAGYQGWLRNIAVALGNAPPTPAIVTALRARADDPSALVREHVAWALQHQQKKTWLFLKSWPMYKVTRPKNHLNQRITDNLDRNPAPLETYRSNVFEHCDTML